MKLIKTEDAVGQVLCHDMTQIIPGVSKDARFRKGHIVTEEDIPVLLSMGKEHLFVWQCDEHTLHENDAATILADACQNSNMERSLPKEGKIELKAEIDGLLEIDLDRLDAINALGDIMIATVPNHYPATKGMKLCGTRIIPLVIGKETMKKVRLIADRKNPILSLHPYLLKDASVIVTGNEVKKGIIKDAFSQVVVRKLREYGIETKEILYSGDERETISAMVREQVGKGRGMVLCTGGMSVDPDDQTPGAIKDSGARIVSYGAPVLPGAMFLLSYLGSTPVVGLPGCVMYAKRTVFDLVLPRLAACVPVSGKDLSSLGNGGLCQNCPECHYPNCAFGKGGR